MPSKTVKDVYKQTKRHRPSAKAADKQSSNTEAQPRTSNRTVGEILREFDLTLEYGPCVGITRLERWLRAEKHGLNPPKEVKDIIMEHSEDTSYTQSVWVNYNI